MTKDNPDPAATTDDIPPTVASNDPANAETLAPTESWAGMVPLSPQELEKLGFPAIPGYDLLEELGRGAMGVVFKAMQVELKRLVALKMILSGSQAGTAQVQRFRTEAEAAARLDHLSIVPIYEVGEHQGHHFFSMKLVEGGTLAGWIADCRKQKADLQPEEQIDIARLMATVSRAIHHAHQHGLLHRDLKPANILLQYPKAAECNLASAIPLVADFGLAKRVEGESSLTQSGVIVGTPSYMAPEQAAGKKKLTPAADIYSLGAILYELLTGRQPFQGESIMATLVHVMEREPPQPRSCNRSVSRDLETICMKAMAKDPQRRYATALELAEELERFAAGQPIKARPAGMLERAWRRCRKHPLATGVGAVLLIALVLTAGFFLYNRRGDGSLDRIQSAGKIRIAVANNYPPMEFRSEGKLAGFDVDLAEQVAARLGVLVDFQEGEWDWPQVPDALKRNTCDMAISTWNITSERKEQVAFVEYLRMGLVFVCKKGTVVKSEKDLAGKIVAVGADTVQHRYVKGLLDKGIAIKEIKVVEGGGDPFPTIKKGEADVTVIDEPVGRYQARIDADFVVTGVIGHAMDPAPVGMAFRTRDRQLQEAVQKAILAMKEDGSFGRILEKWFGK